MAVGFYDFQSLHNKDFQSHVLERFSEIVSTNAFVEGKYNTLFEEEFAKISQTKHCLLVANGTDALEISLLAYGIGHGDLVAIPNISFYATAEVVYNVGATPIFVDIDPTTGLIDPASLKKMTEAHPQIKAVIPVHIYGMPAPIEEIEKICRPLDIKIIEDGAQSHGGYYANKKPIGSSHNLITYSFYPTKNIGAFGDAGAILTQDDELANKIRLIRNHGRGPEGHTLIGRNSRCDHLQAAVIHLKLAKHEEHQKARRQAAKWYFDALKDIPDLEQVPESMIELSSWHLYPIRLKTREKKYQLQSFLKERQLGCNLFYEKSMAEELPLLNVAGEKKKGLEFAARTICLAMHPFIKKEHVQEMKQAIQDFLA